MFCIIVTKTLMFGVFMTRRAAPKGERRAQRQGFTTEAQRTWRVGKNLNQTLRDLCAKQGLKQYQMLLLPSHRPLLAATRDQFLKNDKYQKQRSDHNLGPPTIKRSVKNNDLLD
jgi:hypothetical protein